MGKKGEQVATEALLKEARTLSKDLQNGSASNLEKQGNAIGIILTLLTPIVIEDYVTFAELERKLAVFRSECPVHSKWQESQKQHFSIAGYDIKAPTGAFGIAFLAFVFFVGKGNGWW